MHSSGTATSLGKSCKSKKRKDTLQVQILSRPAALREQTHKCLCRKDVYFSASVSVEAAVCLTFFIFAAVCLMIPMKVMNTQRRIQAAMESAGQDMARYAYLKDAAENGKLFCMAGASLSDSSQTSLLTDAAGKALAYGKIAAAADTDRFGFLSLADSRIFEDGENLVLSASYEISMPTILPGLHPLKFTQVTCRRAWIGRAGKDYDGSSAGDDYDPLVYVGKNPTRYHLSRSCHYLSNNLKEVEIEDIGDMRNQNGEKYRPCAVCGDAGGDYLSVFVMSSGTSYHTDPLCSAIISYVRVVHLSEVEGLGACSYCGGG